MNKLQLITLLITGLMATVMILTTVNLLVRRLRAEGVEHSRVKPAFGIYLSGLLIAGLLPQLQCLSLLDEALGNIIRMSFAQPFVEMGKTALLFTGMGLLWFLLWYVASRAFATVVLGAGKDREELVLGNTYHFVVKSVLLVALVLLMSPVLNILLRSFLPSVSLPFVH